MRRCAVRYDKRVKGFTRALAVAATAALLVPALGARAGQALPDGAAPKTVRFWVPARGGYLTTWREAARRAQQAHPDVQIRVEPMWGDYTARLTLALAERQAPDLVVVDPTLAARLASRGWLADVTGVVASYTPPAAALQAFTWHGRVYAVPGFLDPVLLYANAEHLAAAGLEPPSTSWNWDRLLEAGRQLVNSGTSRWAMGVNGWPPLAMFIWQAGGALLEPPGQPWSGDAAVLEAARYYRRFIDEGLSPPAPASWQRPPEVLFRTAEAAFMMGLFSDPLEVPGAPSPFRPGEPPVAGGRAFAVRIAPVPAGPVSRATWAWVEGAAVPEPATPDALAALVYLAEALHSLGWRPHVPGRADAQAAADAALPFARTLPADPAFLEFDAVFWDHLVVPLVRDGPVDAATLLHRTWPHLQQILQRPVSP